MNLRLLFIFLFCTSLFNVVRSQTYLTHGQVYNFDIGDVFQARGVTPWNSLYPYKYETRTITNKVYSPNNDTIFYTVNITTYLPPPTSCGTCTAVYTNTTITETITHLNDSATTHNNQTSSCMFMGDSIKTDGCGKVIWKKYPIPSVSCTIPPTQQTTVLMTGLGGPYYEYNGLGSGAPLPGYWAYTLIYYSKQVGGSCGSLITSIDDETDYKSKISIYPNPASNAININSSTFNII